MFQCRERQRGCANTNIGWQTLCGSRQTWDLLPPPPKLKIQNGDDDTNTKQPQHKDKMTSFTQLNSILHPW